MKTLYLRIYLTVVAVLLVFALVAGVVIRQQAEGERARIEAAVSERMAAWGSLIENNLPAVDTSDDEQRSALLDWAQRLRLPLALDDAAGRRIATSPVFARREAAAGGMPNRAVKVPMADGRALWLLRPNPRFGLGRPRDADDMPTDRPRLGQPPGPRLRPLDPARPMEPGMAMPGAMGPGPGHGPGAMAMGPPNGGLGDEPPPSVFAFALFGGLRTLGDSGGLVMLLFVLFVAIAAGSYPVVRRLTRRLERLKGGVEAFGAGQLDRRVDEAGRDEVAAVARSFNQAARRIEDLVRANRSLLANASHELRSPLARLKMAVAMMEDAGAERRSALKQEIDRDIRELDALVEEVLLASRLDASHDTAREPVELLGVLAEEAARVDVQIEGESVQVQGDERLLRRAVRNLLENARRHGGGEVEADLHRAGAQVVVRVSDRGPGVPADERERIFEPFYRLAGHGEQSGGVGLGLSLVRQIAERHGGSVRCEARDGGGSRFVLALPA